jgi:hypothetical protein
MHVPRPTERERERTRERWRERSVNTNREEKKLDETSQIQNTKQGNKMVIFIGFLILGFSWGK